jgi:hypothetical protein
MVASSRKLQRSNRDRLGVIIRQRLELAEEWFPLTRRPAQTFNQVKNWKEFERRFKELLELGCRGGVMLTCLSRFASYNGENIVVTPGTYDPDTGELIREPKKKRQAIVSPPNASQRGSISANLNAAIADIEKYEQLLLELGTVNPPLVEEFGDLSTDLSVVYLTRLLRWSCRLLSEDSVGNFATVQSAGTVAPCVYMELLLIRRGRKLGPALGAVAGILNEISNSTNFNKEQLRANLARFKKDYGAVYRELREKILVLHQSAGGSPDDWRTFFLAYSKSRR